MGKVIAIGPDGQAQAPARRDLCRPVIELVIERQLLDRKLLSPVCPTLARADRLRKDLYLSARYYCACDRRYCTRKNTNYGGGCPRGGLRISCQAYVVLWTDPGDGKKKYRVEFRLWDKQESMRHIVAAYGPDPNQWPYFARRKRLKEE